MTSREIHIRLTDTECRFLRWLAEESEEPVTTVVRRLVRQELKRVEAMGLYNRATTKLSPIQSQSGR